MQVSVEKINNVERRLTITVPATKVEEAYTKQINHLAKNAKIKGFRPGKAPLSYIQQQFGADARKEVLSIVIQQSLSEAITDQKLSPISQPVIKPKVIKPNEPLEFEASFEVLPEIGDIKFSLSQVEKLAVDITDADLDEVIERLRKQHASWKLVDRAAQRNDRLVTDYYAILEGKEEKEHQITNHPIELGSNIMLPGFEEGLIGATTGEERKLSLSFPADFAVKERAGKPVEFVVTVKQIFEGAIPALDEEFIKRLGVKTGQLDDFKAQIKQSLQQERDRLVQENLKEQVFQALWEQNPLEVPASLIQQEAKRIHDDIYPPDRPHQHDHHEDELARFNDIAKKRVALGLLVAQYAEKQQLKVDLGRVEKRIQEIASAYEEPEQVVKYLAQPANRRGIESQVLEEQILDKLLEGITINTKTMTYAELKGIRK
jgi:trigger factor